MTKPEAGQIRLDGDDVLVSFGQDDTTNDETYARRLQAQDPNWQV